MVSATVEEARRLFRNNTDGWLGVVQVGPDGRAEGQAVEPGGTIWLSERECRLTAHAPRRAEDNPFLTQTYQVRNPETGDTTDVEVTPLTIVEDTRAIPTSDRFIPGDEGVATAPLQAHTEEKAIPQPAPRADEGPPPPAVSAPAPPPVPPGVRAAAEAAEQARRAEEEHAAVATPDKEETGAAVPPAGEAAQGEYAAHEEVGTPDLPPPPRAKPVVKPYTGEDG